MPSHTIEQLSIVTIGRATDCDVVINQPAISGRHAAVVVGPDQVMTLFDLDSRNGVYVGNEPRRRVRVTTLARDETLHFGLYQIDVERLIGDCWKASKSPSTSEPQMKSAISMLREHLRRETSTQKTTPYSKLLPLTVPMVVILCALFWIQQQSKKPINVPEREDFAADSVVTSREVDQKVLTGNPKDEHIDVEKDVATKMPDTSPLNPSVNVLVDDSTSSALDKPIDLPVDQSLYWLIMSHDETKTKYRMGSAFAIDSNRVVTNASLLAGIDELLKNGFSNPELIRVHDRTTVKIVDRIVPKEFTHRTTEAEALLKHYKTLAEQRGAKAEDDKVLRELEEMVHFAQSQSASVDFGWLRASISLEVARLEPDAKLRPGKSVTIVSAGFDAEDPFFDPEANHGVSRYKARIKTLDPGNDGNPSLFRIQLPSNTVKELNLLGNPVLMDEKIIGMIVFQSTNTVQETAILEIVPARVLLDQ